MTRTTHNLLVLAALVFASLNVVAGAKRVKDDGFMRDDDDWNLMEEWFINDKRWRKEGKRDLAKTKEARSEGTFWNVRKAKGFVNQPPPIKKLEVEGGDDIKRCGVVFYYPAFWQRANEGNIAQVQGVNKIPDGKTREAFENPLAISPWCDPEPKGDDWPGWGNKDKKIVFHNYYWETDVTLKDMYLTLSYGSDPNADITTIKDKPDTLKLDSIADKSMWYATASNTSALPDDFNTKADLEYIYGLLKTYADNNRGGLLPNPFKYGIDSRKWSEWTDLDDFWGYVWHNGIRLHEPTEIYPDCPNDADDLSLC